MAITWDELLARLNRISKKDAYIYVSLFFCVFLLATIINDIVHLTITEKTWNTTSKFTMALLLVHTLAFYFGVLGFLYTSQAEGVSSRMAVLALGVIVANFLVFIFRTTLEVVAISYREEYFRLASESGK